MLQDAKRRLDISDPALGSRVTVILADSADPRTFASSVKDSADSFTETESESISISGNSVSVYLDPMYPSNTIGRKSKVKKESQMLHRYVYVYV